MCSTAVDSLQQECGELPVKLRRKRAVLRYSTKLKLSTKNPAASILEDSWQIHYSKWKPEMEPIYLQTKLFISGIDISQTGIKMNAPWNGHVYIDTSLTSILHTTDEIAITRQHALNLLITYQGKIQIYTDASVMESGRAGVAFYIPDHLIEAEIRIADKTSVVMSELLAIYSALKFLETTIIKCAEIVIITDSLSAIRLIMECQCMQLSTESEILNSIENLLRKQQITTHIVWIPGHIGISGNERVDLLAKNATAKSEIDIKSEITLHELYCKIDQEIYEDWQKLYSESPTARSYKEIEPTVNKEIKFTNKNRRKEVIITRLRLGKCRLNSCLQKINRHDTGLCDTCKVPETVQHFLLDCQVSNIFYKSQVKTVKEALSSPNMEKIYRRILEMKRNI